MENLPFQPASRLDTRLRELGISHIPYENRSEALKILEGKLFDLGKEVLKQVPRRNEPPNLSFFEKGKKIVRAKGKKLFQVSKEEQKRVQEYKQHLDRQRIQDSLDYLTVFCLFSAQNDEHNNLLADTQTVLERTSSEISESETTSPATTALSNTHTLFDDALSKADDTADDISEAEVDPFPNDETLGQEAETVKQYEEDEELEEETFSEAETFKQHENGLETSTSRVNTSEDANEAIGLLQQVDYILKDGKKFDEAIVKTISTLVSRIMQSNAQFQIKEVSDPVHIALNVLFQNIEGRT